MISYEFWKVRESRHNGSLRTGVYVQPWVWLKLCLLSREAGYPLDKVNAAIDWLESERIVYHFIWDENKTDCGEDCEVRVCHYRIVFHDDKDAVMFRLLHADRAVDMREE